MTVKEYLNRARFIDREIDAKLDHLSRLNSIIYKASATISDMPGSPTRDVTRRERAIAKVIDLQKEIDDEIDRLVDTKKEINAFINQIGSNDYRLLLELRYVNLCTWEKVAETMNVDVRTVYRMHGGALLEAGKNYKS